MLRVPHCLCQAMTWAFPMCNLYASEIAFPRGFQQRLQFHHFLAHHIILLGRWDYPSASRWLSVSQNHSCFRLLTSRVLLPRFHSSHFSLPLAPFPGSSSTVCGDDATFEPAVRTWVQRRPYPLVSFGWIPPPLPCAMDNGSHIRWPLLIPPRTLHLQAGHKLRSLEIPSPPLDQLSILWYVSGWFATPLATTPRSTPSPNGVQTPASPVIADYTF